MGIRDRMTALGPRRHRDSAEQPVGGGAMALRNDFDRWFQRFVEDPWSTVSSGGERFSPSVDVRETPTHVVVTAEVPGIDPKEVDLSVVNGNLIVRGEKRQASEDTSEDVHVSEVRYGAFTRSIPLPRGVDTDHADAQVRNGVLTVTFPKTNERAGRIPVRT